MVMKIGFETNSGRKGYKLFENDLEFVNFMTENSHKIKNMFVEGENPYDEKTVKVAKASTSKGWEKIDSSAFGDIAGDGEKGESVLSSNSESVFKNAAQFEPSKTSEKSDKQEEVKVEKSPVKADNADADKSKKVSPNYSEFKYDEKVNESVFDDMDKDINVFNKAADEFVAKQKAKQNKKDEKKDDENIEEGIKDYLPRAGFIKDDEKKVGAFVGQGTDEQLKKAKIIALVKFAHGDRMGRVSKEDLNNFDEYYEEYQRIFGEVMEEGIMDKLPKAGFIRDDDDKKVGAFFGNGDKETIRKAKIIAFVKYAEGDRMGRVTKEDLANFDDYYERYKEYYGDKTVEEGFKDGLKKAGKYARGALAGAAMAATMANPAHGVENRANVDDNASSAYEEVIEINGNKVSVEQLKKQGFSDKEIAILADGGDPFYDGARQPFEEGGDRDEEWDCEDKEKESLYELDEDINDILRISGVN